MKQSNAFGLASLLAVVVTLVVLFWLTSVALFPRGALPSVDGASGSPGQPGPMDRAHAIKCLTNLKMISTGVAIYKADNSDRTPVRHRSPASDAGVNAAPTFANATDADYADSGWAELGDQGMQNVWLMIASGDVQEVAFHCPGDAGFQQRAADGHYGWTSPNHFSYSIQWPYTLNAEHDRNPAPFIASLDLRIATFADRNPGRPMRGAPVPGNHPAAGTNAIVGDIPTVLDTSRVSLGGGMYDSIYSNDAQEPGGMPTNKTDSSLTIAPRAGVND